MGMHQRLRDTAVSFWLVGVGCGVLGRDVKSERWLLNDGTEMPIIGLGVWRSKKNEVADAVYHAVCNAGYRHIDAAQIYGNHDEVGQGLARALKTESCGVARKDVWITSKLWNVDFAPHDVASAVDTILVELGLDYVDQVLLHWPVPYKKPPSSCPPDCPAEFASTDDPRRPRDADGNLVHSQIPLAETWQALEEVQRSGKIRSIGVSNFNAREIRSLLTGAHSTVPAVNQVEAHVFWQQTKLRKQMEELGIVMVAYSPLGNPALYGDKLAGMTGNLITGVAEDANLTPAQVMLSFLLGQGVIVIPKSVTPSRIDSNINFDPSLLTPAHREKLIMEAPQARLANPKNRPGGKPVFAAGDADPKEEL